jgi:hypothetical protein
MKTESFVTIDINILLAVVAALLVFVQNKKKLPAMKLTASLEIVV